MDSTKLTEENRSTQAIVSICRWRLAVALKTMQSPLTAVLPSVCVDLRFRMNFLVWVFVPVVTTTELVSVTRVSSPLVLCLTPGSRVMFLTKVLHPLSRIS